MKRYSAVSGSKPKWRKFLLYGVISVILAVAGWFLYKQFAPSTEEKVASQLQFDDSVTEAEKQIISQTIADKHGAIDGTVQVRVETSLEAPNTEAVLAAYLPVTHQYAVRQNIEAGEFAASTVTVPEATDEKAQAAIAGVLSTEIATGPTESPSKTAVVLLSAEQLTPEVKLLQLNGAYYLDSFTNGAVFRYAVYGGDAAEELSSVPLSNLAIKDTTLKVNLTGVTALTRLMMRKLNTVGSPTFFSEKIGPVLADADITHVSNEVSFREGCQYSNTLFCSPPEFIETLKASGVDLVELTGNHNNDNGSTYNTETIKLYESLGMKTFGGGISSTEAAKPYYADQKGSKVAFIGYNLADGAGSGAIAGETTAGANLYSDTKAQADITAAKQNGQFVVVHIQYAECQAYPSGYVEFPECDGTIGGQQAAFRKMIDYGADMVVGSSAHQPQTYEFYNGKPIYYGLGNLYFEQTQWPGTERGIILTSYFVGGKLVQTKLSPTVCNKDYQTRLMTNEEAEYLLERLDAAR